MFEELKISFPLLLEDKELFKLLNQIKTETIKYKFIQQRTINTNKEMLDIQKTLINKKLETLNNFKISTRESEKVNHN